MEKILTTGIVYLIASLLLSACIPTIKTGDAARSNTKTIEVKPVTSTLKPNSAATGTAAAPATASNQMTSLPFDLCRGENVEVRFGDLGNKNQRTTISINLTSHADSLCDVALFPAVQLLDSTGNPLDYTHRFFKNDTSTDSYFAVEPGQTVGFLISWTNWCDPATDGIRIQLTLPQASTPIEIPTIGTPLEKPAIYGGAVCLDRGKPSAVYISQFGTNVPVPLDP